MAHTYKKQHFAVFAAEMHSSEPERLVAFYENELGVKFSQTAYPFPRFIADLGRFALIIADSRGQDADTASEPGKMTLDVLSPLAGAEGSRPYFLYPRRVIGGVTPERTAARTRDPDGNYLALVNSMEHLLGRMPPISSWLEMLDCLGEFALLRLRQLRLGLLSRMDRLRDNYQYSTGHVSIESRDLHGFSHLVASREGLFAVNTTSHKRLARGRFFGMTLRNGDIYCFQSCGVSDLAGSHPPKGRIVRFSVSDGRIAGATVTNQGLDDGIHQIDFLGDFLLVADCHNGRILKMRPGSQEFEAFYPLGPLTREEAWVEYHMNSMAAHPDGTLWLLLHNSLRKPSEIAVVNSEFEIVRRFELSAGAAHNIVFTNDGLEYLVADSYGGRILSAQGPVVDGGMLLPRGISLDKSTCVFGESYFATREFRRYVPGRVHFVDRQSWKTVATVELPAAPTEIRRLDGKDFSLSNYTLAESAAESTPAAQ